MSQFYTRKGDNGYTGILGKDRIPKYHPRIETIGIVDEANAALGMVRAICLLEFTRDTILEIQHDLYQLMAELAATPENSEKFRAIRADRVVQLEKYLDSATIMVDPRDKPETISQSKIPNGFIIPGDSQAGAALDFARTVIRRAERQATQLLHNGEINNNEILRYLNRLSSVCFVLELLENQAAGKTKPTMAKG
jgi:cob(I)alamin adenosyltransferase